MATGYRVKNVGGWRFPRPDIMDRSSLYHTSFSDASDVSNVSFSRYTGLDKKAVVLIEVGSSRAGCKLYMLIKRSMSYYSVPRRCKSCKAGSIDEPRMGRFTGNLEPAVNNSHNEAGGPRSR